MRYAALIGQMTDAVPLRYKTPQNAPTASGLTAGFAVQVSLNIHVKSTRPVISFVWERISPVTPRTHIITDGVSLPAIIQNYWVIPLLLMFNRDATGLMTALFQKQQENALQNACQPLRMSALPAIALLGRAGAWSVILPALNSSYLYQTSNTGGSGKSHSTSAT
jgi:hypothetical protein